MCKSQVCQWFEYVGKCDKSLFKAAKSKDKVFCFNFQSVGRYYALLCTTCKLHNMSLLHLRCRHTLNAFSLYAAGLLQASEIDFVVEA